MRRTIIFTGILVLIAVAAGIFFGIRDSKKPHLISSGPAGINSILIGQTPVHFKKFSEPQGHVSFDTVKEWTARAPAEELKTVTIQELDNYDVVYHAANSQGAIFTVSKKGFTDGTTTLEDIFQKDSGQAKIRIPGYRVNSQKVTDQFVEAEVIVTIAGTPYRIYQRAMLQAVAKEKADIYYLMQVTVPAQITGPYQDVIRHLFDSMETGAAAK